MKELRSMKVITKKLLALIIGMAVVLTAIPSPVSHASTETVPAIEISQNSQYAGNSTKVSVQGKNFESLAGIEMSLYYDSSVLTVQSVESGSLMSNSIVDINYTSAGDGVIKYSMANIDGITGSGTIMNIVFSINEDAQPGTYPITLVIGDAYNLLFNSISITKSMGSVSVLERQQAIEKVYFYSGLDKSSISQDETITYTLYANYVYSLAGGNFIFEYDNSLLELKSASVGDSLITETSLQLINQDTPGYVKVSYADIEAMNAYYGTEMVVLEFTAKQDVDAKTNISFSSDSLLDGNLNAMTSSDFSTEVQLIKKAVETVKHPFSLVWNQEISDQKFVIDVVVDGDSTIAAGDFNIGYDKTQLNCVSVETDSSVSTNGGYLLTNETIDNGTIKFSFVNIDGITKDQTLIHITFEIKDHYVGDTIITSAGSNVVDANFNDVSLDYMALKMSIPPLYVSEIILTDLQAPEVEEPLDASVNCLTEGVTETILPISWEPRDTTVAYNTGYTATIPVYLSNGYAFEEDILVTVDENPVDDVVLRADGSVLVTIPFDKTPKAKLLSIILPDEVVNLNDGISIKDVGLPETVGIETEDKNIVLAPVIWDLNSTVFVKGTDIGDAYVVSGSVNCPDDINVNDVDLTITISVVLKHKYVDTVTDPTCTEKGFTTHTCSVCKDSYTDTYVAALNHSFTNYKSDKDATCTEDGTYTAKCNRCDVTDTVTDEGSATGHNYVSVVSDPTCTEKGFTTHTCSACKDSYIDTYVAALNHSFTNYKSDNNATCTEDGTLTAKCDRCDVTDTVTDEESATGHSLGVWVETEAATCTKDGSQRRDCADCDYYETDTIPALGHKASAEWTITKPASCTESGSKYHACTNGCSEKLDVTEIPATGHNWNGGTLTHESTCETGGTLVYECLACTETYLEEIAVLGHVYSKEWIVDEAASCLKTGLESRHCTRIGCNSYIDQREIPLQDHSWDNGIQTSTPSCTIEGSITYTCTITGCGKTFTEQVEATGHNVDIKWTIFKEASCSEAGSKHHICLNGCDEIFDITEIPAKGHVSVTDPAVSATCTTAGKTEGSHCSICNTVIKAQTTVPAPGHDYEAVVTEPTCTRKGFTTHTCSACKDIYVDSYTDAKDHSFTNYESDGNATCFKDGTKTAICNRCTATDTVTEPGSMTDHNYNYLNETILKHPTCDTEGLRQYTCSTPGCGATITEYINPPGHFEKYVDSVNPTCTTDGHTDGSRCSVCNEVISGLKVIPAKGHTAVVDQAVITTCTTAGKTEGSHCSICNTVIKAQTTVPAPGHDYEAVVTEPTCTRKGFTTHTCSACKDSYVDSYTDAKDHSFTNYESDGNATCFKDGTKTAICNRCDATDTVTDPGSMTDHNYDYLNGIILKHPTCDTEGLRQYTCSTPGCSATITEYINSPGHFEKYVDSVNPTCTTDGHTDGRRCSVCNEIISGLEVIPAKGHTAVVDQAVITTCTTAGKTEGSHCSVCNTVLKAQTTIAALGHKWDAGVITTPATSSKPGVKTYTCSVCKTTKTESVSFEGYDIERVWGASRYKTSLAIADELKAELDINKFSTVIIANGANFPDALAGSYLAAKKDAPILMVNPKGDNSIVQTYIEKNLVSKGKVYILGGTAAVPQDVEDSLKANGYDVERLKGKGRYDTNLEILKEAGVSNEAILVCTGINFADSLSSSAAGLPILLVDPGTQKLSDAQIDFLDDAKREIYIIGGSGAVSDTYLSALTKYDSNGTVDRVKGKTRYETSVEVAKKFCKNPDNAIIASAQNFPDGLCGGPLAYVMDAPLILTNPTVDTGKLAPAKTYIADMKITSGKALGGGGALADDVVRTVFGMSSGDKITGEKYE